MKKTGSIRVEIKTDVPTTSYYEVKIPGHELLTTVPKSALTDIREEVDWSKVKRSAIVAVWQEYSEPAGAEIKFYRGRANGGFQIAPWKTYDGKPEYYECAMPLDQWRKKHGGQDE